MKAIITDTLRYNLNMAIPVAQKNNIELYTSFLKSDAVETSDFSRRKMAAKLVFDEVNEYKPNYEAQNEEIDVIRKIRSALGDGNSLIYNKNDYVFSVHHIQYNESFSEYELKVLNNIIKQMTISENIKLNEYNLILSNDSFYTQQYLQSINQWSYESAIALLATAGVEFSLPAIYCRDDEVIEKIKSDFELERMEYLHFLHQNIDDICEQLQSLDAENNLSSEDIEEFWNQTEKLASGLKIKARIFEAAIRKADNKIKKSLIDGFFEFAPTILSSLVEGNDFKKSFIEGLLKIFGGTFVGQSAYHEMRERHPEAAYIYKIRKNLAME